MATTPNPEAESLKAKRATAKTSARTRPPDADIAPEIGVEEPARRFPLLGDPREPLVLGASGMTLGGDHDEKYVRAEVDGIERITPRGCATSIARQRWSRGQLVLRTVYDAYVAQHARTPEGAATKESDTEPAAS